jgi:hypothetical protein
MATDKWASTLWALEIQKLEGNRLLQGALEIPKLAVNLPKIVSG